MPATALRYPWYLPGPGISVTKLMPTYEGTLAYLDSFINYEQEGFDLFKKEFNLGKLRGILKDLGSPQKTFTSVHVAGTKGKGSICTYVSSILRGAGHKVGLFLSPHLVDVRERISVNGKMISKKDLTLVMAKLKKVLDERPDAEELTFFEVLTLAAVLYFREREADYAVFEVGMGGRLDATNVIDAKVSAISPISYDHTDVLGKSIVKIALEKAAIIKKGGFCISSPQRPSALEVIKKECRRKSASLFLVGKDIDFSVRGMDERGSSFDVSGIKADYAALRTVMPGGFQPANCAAAIGVCEQVLRGKKGIDIEAVKRGVKDAYIPGRLEVLARNPFIVIDGAQNAESASRLKYSVEDIFKYDKLILLLGLSKDKDIKGVCRELAPLADEVILTRASSKRAASPEIIRGFLKGKKATITRGVKEALGLALAKSAQCDLVLATGSFYMIGEVRELLR